MDPSDNRESEIADRLRVMVLLQQSEYKCRDYLMQPPLASQSSTATLISDLAPSSSTGVNELWREKICKWTYEVVDHFDFNREIVAVSLSYLDRFLSARQVNHKTFQLASMTALYLAIKLYGPKTLRISSLIELSRGYFKAEHIAAMEKFILRDLSWKVHPPTSQSFFRHFFELPSLERIAADPAAKQELTDLSHFLIELSVCDYFFVTRSPSSIAIASICNALDEISASSSPLGKAELLVIQKEFSTEVVKYASDALHTDGGEVAKCRQRLRYMYQNAVCRQNELEDESHLDERLENMSPSCVSDENVDWQPSHKSVEHPRKTSKTETRTSPGGASQKKNYSS